MAKKVAEQQAFADLLNQYDKITRYCGLGAAELVQLAVLLHSPVGYTCRAKLEIQFANPNEVGLTGLLGMNQLQAPPGGAVAV